jgi:hypothetical protein
MDGYNQIVAICKQVLNSQHDNRKFITLRQGIQTFEESRGRPMNIDEFVDYARTQFSDRTFVDNLVRYCAMRWPDQEEIEEGTCKDPIPISNEKLLFLIEVIENLPLIIKKDKNLSNQMFKVLNEEKKHKVSPDILASQNDHGPMPSHINRHDPHLQKLLELIYANVKKRFQVFTNAYCYLDFNNRGLVSYSDWQRGLDGFAIKVLPRDAKLLFQYLTHSDGGPQVMMTQDQFMRLNTEKSIRNVDPFELQVF